MRHLSYRDTSLLIPSSYQTAAWLFIGSPWSLSVMNICSSIRKHCAPFSDTSRVHNMFAHRLQQVFGEFHRVWRSPPAKTESRLAPSQSAGSWYQRVHCLNLSHSQRGKSLQHELHQATVHTLLNTPHDSSAKIKQLRGLYAQTFLNF